MKHRHCHGRIQISSAEVRSFSLIAIITAFAAGVGFLPVLSSSRPDLSDLTPVEPAPDGTQVLAWASLLRHHSLIVDAGNAPHAGMELRALGYAMDGERPLRDGERVSAFALLPGAGNLVHPAHRFGDQMIAVHLRQGDSFQFHAGELVWVHGTLRILSGDPVGQIPLYVLEQASAEPAGKTAIARLFR